MRTPETFPDLRIDPPSPPGILLWDGDCGFCTGSVKLLTRLARTSLPNEPLPSFLGQALAEVGDQVIWVDSDGRVWGGTQALARALAAAGREGMAKVLLSPGLNPVFRMTYRVVAATRHRLWPGRCRIHTSR